MSDEMHSADLILGARNLLGQIADKWSVLILGTLCHEALRFNAIKHRLNGVTQKALTEALRRLERNGIIDRRILPGPPLGVEYSVTALGRTLEPALVALHSWSLNHYAEVERARWAYDDCSTPCR